MLIILRGHIQLFSLENADGKDRSFSVHLALHMHRDRVARKETMQGFHVAIVVAATFPTHHAEVPTIVMRSLDNKFELDSAKFTHHLIVKLSVPDVSLMPLSLEATSTVVVPRIPIAKLVAATDQPQLLSKVCLIFDTNPDLFEANGSSLLL